MQAMMAYNVRYINSSNIVSLYTLPRYLKLQIVLILISFNGEKLCDHNHDLVVSMHSYLHGHQSAKRSYFACTTNFLGVGHCHSYALYYCKYEIELAPYSHNLFSLSILLINNDVKWYSINDRKVSTLVKKFQMCYILQFLIYIVF